MLETHYSSEGLYHRRYRIRIAIVDERMMNGWLMLVALPFD